MSLHGRIAPLVLVGSTCAIASGCSLLVDVDGLAGVAADASVPTDASATTDAKVDATNDASATDGSTPDATPDAVPDPNAHVGPNLLEDSSFETSCSSFSAFQGSAVSDPTARTGSRSCRVCTDPPPVDYFTADAKATVSPTRGATYHAVAWVRTAPGAATPPSINISARTYSNPPFQAIESTTSPSPVVPTSTWQKVETTLTIAKAAPEMDIFVGTGSAPGACFLLDDFWLEKLP